jgi:hypothetical protein
MDFEKNRVKHNKFFHILSFRYFSNNRNVPDKMDENYDSFRKMRTVFDKLNIKKTQTILDKNLHAMLF